MRSARSPRAGRIAKRLTRGRNSPETGGLRRGATTVPSPQSLVTFVTTLAVLLVATRVGFGLDPIVCALGSTVLALALAWVVDRNTANDESVDDDITEEAERDASKA